VGGRISKKELIQDFDRENRITKGTPYFRPNGRRGRNAGFQAASGGHDTIKTSLGGGGQKKKNDQTKVTSSHKTQVKLRCKACNLTWQDKTAKEGVQSD